MTEAAIEKGASPFADAIYALRNPSDEFCQAVWSSRPGDAFLVMLNIADWLEQHPEAADRPVDLPLRRLGKGDIVVASYLTDPLLMADNAVGQCPRCLSLIQYRPYHLGSGVVIVCSPCALRLLEPGDA